MFKKALHIWFDIAGMMFLIIFVDFVFFQLLMEEGLFFYMKQIFIALFTVTVLASVYFVGFFFNKHKIETKGFWGYLKLYFAVFWRAMVFVVPVVGLIAVIFKGSIASRILRFL